MRTSPFTLIVAISSAALLAPGTLSGCSTSQSPYRSADSARRDTAKAERLTREAADLIATDPVRAEELLREALVADLYHGPAHNNLGVLFMNQDMLYEAANEFEWARRLMPGHPDPRVNLGLALERGGRTDEAIASYRSALDSAPEYLPGIQALVSCQIRTGNTDEQTEGHLALIRSRGSPNWREWATDHALTLESASRLDSEEN